MDEEEKLRLLIIIEKLLKDPIKRTTRLERIKDDLEKDSQISEFDKNFVLDQWGKNQGNDSIKKPKSNQLHPAIKILIIGLVILTIVIPVSLALSQTEDITPQKPIFQKSVERDTSPSKTPTNSLDTKNSFLEKFGELENNREKVELEFSSEESIDNKIWQVYDVIRIEPDSSRSNVGFLMFSTPNGYIETIIFKIQHNFDIDVMGIAELLFERLGKEYIYLWSDEACLNEKYDDRCFDDGYNNKYMHFLNGGDDGLTWRERADIISGVSVGVEREFKEYFTANFHIIE